MLQTEFIKQYCDNSNMTEQQIFDVGLFAIPCDCGADNCKGWAMIDRDQIEAHDYLCVEKCKTQNGMAGLSSI
jgi:hypothetical protein